MDCAYPVDKLVGKVVVIHKQIIIGTIEKLSTIYPHVTKRLLTVVGYNLLINKYFKSCFLLHSLALLML